MRAGGVTGGANKEVPQARRLEGWADLEEPCWPCEELGLRPGAGAAEGLWAGWSRCGACADLAAGGCGTEAVGRPGGPVPTLELHCGGVPPGAVSARWEAG